MILTLNKLDSVSERYNSKNKHNLKQGIRLSLKRHDIKNYVKNQASVSSRIQFILPPKIQSATRLHQKKVCELNRLTRPSQSVVTYYMISAHIPFLFGLNQLQGAFSTLVAKHPNLKAAFDLNTYNQPLKIVYRDIFIPFHILDMRNLNAAQQKKYLGIWFNTEKQQSFEITHAPLFRVFVHIKTQKKALLSIVTHAALFELKQLVKIFNELLSLMNQTKR